jgi:hypothetical protein
MSLLETKCVLSFNCTYCNKQLSTKQNCNRHMKTCKSKQNYFEEENKKLKQLLKEKDEEIYKKDEKIMFLKSLLETKNSPATIINNYKPTTSNNTINNNINLNGKLVDLDPIDFNEMKEMFNNFFSEKYVDKGIEGLAHFLCDIPCKDKIVTTDFSRKLVKYKKPDNQVVDDPKAHILLSTAIKQNADTIIDKAEGRYQYFQSQIKEARQDDIEPDKSDIEKRNKTKKLKKIATKAKGDISVKLEEATNIIVMKGMENKNKICAIE